MKAITFFAVFAALLVSALPVQASAWLHCKIEATVLDVDDTSYKIEVVSGTVVDGHQEKGVPCLKLGENYTIESNDHGLSAGQDVTFDYTYYSGMGPNGVVSDTKWKVLSSSGVDDAEDDQDL